MSTSPDKFDIAAVINERVGRWTDRAAPFRPRSELHIAGLIPKASRVTDPQMITALDELSQAIQGRARSLADHAIATQAAMDHQDRQTSR